MTPAETDARFDAETHLRRRERFLGEIGRGVAILCAGPELVSSRDTEIRYRPESDIYYLTGFTEPGTVVVLTPHDPVHRLTLFVRPRDPEREVWAGTRAGPEGALEQFGASAAYPIGELEDRLKALLEPADSIYYTLGADAAMDARIISLLSEFRSSRARTGKGPTEVRDPGAVLGEMRVIKDERELELMRAAAATAARAHAAVIRATRPGVGEWELEALLESTFRRAGPDAGTAFAPIVGSAHNATTLHYVDNTRRITDGDLVLVDAGASLGLYCSDITRTFPANGRFTPDQLAIYRLVLEAERAAIAQVRAGVPFNTVHEAARQVLVEGMIALGLLSGTPDEVIEARSHLRFYMHQTSHFLGLDVHDVGAYRNADESWIDLRAGMVMTIEPGLYIPAGADDVPERFRGIGVRIEDTVIVTEDGCEIITRGVPVDPEEIEAMVGTE